MPMKRLIPALCLALGGSLCAKAQLYIDNATFFIESGATVTVQGDLTSNASIQGTGKILLKGTALQNVNMNNGGAATNAYTIPNLEIDNTANVTLTGNARIGTSILFTNGKLQAGNFNVVLANAVTATGMGTNKFIETNGTGFVQREIGNTAASDVLLPVGVGSTYSPVSLTHSGGTYASALLGAQAKSGKSPASHPRTESYTNVYWPVATTGVTGGAFAGTGTYPTDAAPGFTGTETDIYGMSYNGSVWSLAGGAQNSTTNTVTAQLAGNSGQLFGMNRFLLLNTRVLLQGAYSGSGAVMNDGLRSGTNVIPTAEPYRSAPYSFTSVNGGTPEVATATVFNDLGTNDNIVDWVFVELRNNVTPVSSLLQTRSVFVQKDGDLVDIDGTSPVYFKNLDQADYTVTVRHRNHLPISTNNAGAFFKNLNIAPSSLLDFTTLATGSVLGTTGTNYLNSGGFNLMYAGNANSNANVRYGGPANDKDYTLSASPLLNNPTTVSVAGYYQTDVNMNKVVRYGGPANDKDFILSTPLGANPAAVKSQILPN